MCGIAGYISKSPIQHSVLRKMGDAISHRGPDSCGHWYDDNVGIGLAHQRLSIVDLSSAGHQPMVSHSGRLVIIFNGEIYNHLDIRKQLHRSWAGRSDTEILIEAFDEWGISKTLKKCVGMFAFAVWDKHSKTLTLGRDRFGEKPLYWGMQKNSLIFGSELKSLTKHPDFLGEIDPESVKAFTRFSYVPAPKTIYKKIYKLMPGTTISFDATNLGASPIENIYWSATSQIQYGNLNPYRGIEDSAINQLDTLLQDSIKSQSIADVPTGAFLSGGIDSSTVVAIYQSQNTQPIKTFSIGFEEAAYNEAHHAKKIANILGTDHTEMIVGSKDVISLIPELSQIYDEPFADSSQLPTLLVSQLARQKVTVSMSGDAGDELFGGYNRYSSINKLNKVPTPLKKLFSSVARRCSPKQWDYYYNLLFFLKNSKFDLKMFGDKMHKLSELFEYNSDQEIFTRSLSSYGSIDGITKHSSDELANIKSLWSTFDYLKSHEHTMMAIDTLTYLPDDILCKVDRAAMHYSLETRVPFLDHRIFEFAWTLPINFKIKNGNKKWILQQVLKKYLPLSLFDRPKMGFGIPVGYWIQGPLKDWAIDSLDFKNMKEDGFYNVDFVQKIFQEHQSGQRNWGQLIWSIIAFQNWKARKLS
jgi:asparagine synthase (glutamine-hydrolysing)